MQVAPGTPLPALHGAPRLRALAGAMLSIGSPAGWLLYSWFAHGRLPQDELRNFPDLYLYMLCGTALAFGAFGYILGTMEAHVTLGAEKLAQANRELEKASRTDVETGLYNAKAFEEQLRQIVSLTRRNKVTLSIVLFHLESYRDLRTKLGARAAAEAAQFVASAFRGQRREEDVLGRVGYDKFAVLLPNTEAQTARFVAERILERIRQESFLWKKQPHRLRMAFGASTLTTRDDARTLYTRADADLQQGRRPQSRQTGRETSTAVALAENGDHKSEESVIIDETLFFDELTATADTDTATASGQVPLPLPDNGAEVSPTHEDGDPLLEKEPS